MHSQLQIWLLNVGNFGHKPIVGIGVGQQGADGEQDLGDGEGGRPHVFQNIEFNVTDRVNIRVVNSRNKVHLGWLEGVVCRKVNVKEVNAARVGGVVWSHYSSLPVEQIFLI